jgi:YegS/Rv2252/BmrU family lipid kinase
MEQRSGFVQDSPDTPGRARVMAAVDTNRVVGKLIPPEPFMEGTASGADHTRVMAVGEQSLMQVQDLLLAAPPGGCVVEMENHWRLFFHTLLRRDFRDSLAVIRVCGDRRSEDVSRSAAAYHCRDSTQGYCMDSAPLIIVNPVAGPSATRLLEPDRLRLALRHRGLAPDWIETRADYDAGEIIDENPGDGPVVVIGGDGTMHAAASRLVGGDRSMLPVPRGSGNVFARSLGIPLLLDRALDLVQAGVVVRVDVGRIADDVFLLGVGIGLDADVIRGAGRELKRRLGGFAYFVSASQTLPVAHHDFEIEVDGNVFQERAASVHVANFGTRAGPFILPPMVDGRDGMLDLVVMKAARLEEVVSLLATPFIPDQRWNKAVRFERGREIQVRAAEILPVQIDGEDQGDHPGLHCHLEPASLPVIVPRRRA